MLMERDLLAAALVILDLAEDLDVLALLAHGLPDSVHVSGLAHKGGVHHVDALLHSKLQVLHVPLGHGRQVPGSPAHVHALLAAQHTAILNITLQEVST